MFPLLAKEKEQKMPPLLAKEGPGEVNGSQGDF